jgi:hypothetical protein
MLGLSGVFNKRILLATNYANQYYMCVNYTYSCLHYTLVTCSQSKNVMFLPGYGPIAIADWSILVHCHLLGKHGL